MDPIEPAYGTTVLLLIAAAAVAILLFLIMKVKLHAFVSLVLVSAVTAVAAGIPLTDVPSALLSGFSSTLGSVALLVALGVMVGRLLEITGGAQVLADTLINRFGAKRAPLALGVAALIFGFPIFFDAGLVVFLPIIFTVAKRFGGSVLLYALPTAGAFAAMHAIVPPASRSRRRHRASRRRYRIGTAGRRPRRRHLLVRRLVPRRYPAR